MPKPSVPRSECRLGASGHGGHIGFSLNLVPFMWELVDFGSVHFCNAHGFGVHDVQVPLACPLTGEYFLLTVDSAEVDLEPNFDASGSELCDR